MKKPGTSSSATASAIAKRKQSSHCWACGERGHWQDDDVCPVKGKQQSHAKGNERGPPSKPNSSSASSQKPQQVFPVVRHDRGHIEIHDTEDFGNAFVCKMVNSLSFHVHEVQAFSSVDFIGKMILDSACQRTCCGRQWYQANSSYLVENFKLRCKHIETSDLFQFGKGEPTQADFRSYIPVGIGKKPLIVATAVLPANIPLSGSNKLLEKLGAVIDMRKCKLFFSKLNVSVPLYRHGWHFTVSLVDFPVHVGVKFQKSTDWKHADPEMMSVFNMSVPETPHITTASTSQEAEPVSTTSRACGSHATSATAMVGQLAQPRGRPPDLRQDLRHPHGDRSVGGIPQQRLASSVTSARASRTCGSTAMPAPASKKVWEPSRPICKVRATVQMESQHRGMGVHGLIALLTIAVAMLREHSASPNHEPSAEFLSQFIEAGVGRQSQTQSTSKSLFYDFLDLYERGTDDTHPGNCAPRGGAEQHARGDGHDGAGQDSKFRRPLHGRASRRPGRGSPRQLDGSPVGGDQRRGRFPMGVVKRLKGNIKRALLAYETESKIYSDMPSVAERPPPYMDVFELFSGSSRFTLLAKRHT